MCIKIMYNMNPFKNVFQYQMAKFNSAKPRFFSIKLIKQFLLIQGKRNGVLVLFNLQLLKYCWWWTYFLLMYWLFVLLLGLFTHILCSFFYRSFLFFLMFYGSLVVLSADFYTLNITNIFSKKSVIVYII